jgi:hypothetical protein
MRANKSPGLMVIIFNKKTGWILRGHQYFWKDFDDLNSFDHKSEFGAPDRSRTCDPQLRNPTYGFDLEALKAT